MTTQVRALIIQVNGMAVHEPVTADLEGITAVVGGPIEMVTLPSCHLYCDEEGKVMGSPVNRAATGLAHLLGWRYGDVLCGPVIFLGNTHDGGEADVPQSVINAWNSLQAG